MISLHIRCLSYEVSHISFFFFFFFRGDGFNTFCLKSISLPSFRGLMTFSLCFGLLFSRLWEYWKEKKISLEVTNVLFELIYVKINVSV